jgi:hypothetical protein
MIEIKDSHEDKIWSEQAAAILSNINMSVHHRGAAIEENTETAAVYADAMIIKLRQRKSEQ